jgi:hypothetical protein
LKRNGSFVLDAMAILVCLSAANFLLIFKLLTAAAALGLQDHFTLEERRMIRFIDVCHII